MSHFTVTVALPGTLAQEEISAALDKAMAPFDENKETPRYVEYTREQLIEKGRQKIEDVRTGNYAKFLEDPEAYAAECSNIRHLDYIAGGTEAARAAVGTRYEVLLEKFEADAQAYYERFGKTLGEPVEKYVAMEYAGSFPAKLEWTDEQVHADMLSWYDESSVGKNGEVYSTYNPDSQWDWFSIGGRWAGYFSVIEKGDGAAEMSDPAWGHLKPTSPADREYVEERTGRPGLWVDVTRKYDVDWERTAGDRGTAATYAFLDSEGKWHEKGSMGWFGLSSGDKPEEEWQAEYTRLVEAESDNAWLVLVDCHI